MTTLDPDTTFQWKRGPNLIVGATGPDYLFPAVGTLDSGSVFTVVVSNNGVSATTPDAILTVVPTQLDNNNFYRSAIGAEAAGVASGRTRCI